MRVVHRRTDTTAKVVIAHSKRGNETLVIVDPDVPNAQVLAACEPLLGPFERRQLAVKLRGGWGKLAALVAAALLGLSALGWMIHPQTTGRLVETPRGAASSTRTPGPGPWGGGDLEGAEPAGAVEAVAGPSGRVRPATARARVVGGRPLSSVASRPQPSDPLPVEVQPPGTVPPPDLPDLPDPLPDPDDPPVEDPVGEEPALPCPAADQAHTARRLHQPPHAKGAGDLDGCRPVGKDEGG